MTSSRLFAIAWRATLFLLPWQARLILSTPQLNGFPWEQATFAIYVSWIPLIATVILAWKQIKERATQQALRPLVVVPIAIFILVSLFTSSWAATLLFWAHALLLGLFVAALTVRQVPVAKIVTWFIFSLIPHALLGVAQFAAQHVWGSTLLGIADQPAWKSGVSVVEYGEHRLLRAYGGFPHPNLFGGWLAVSLIFLPERIRRAKTMAIKFAWIACGALFLYTLVLTFSRGAWIAALAGLVFAFILTFRQAENKKEREALVSGLLIFLAAVTIAVATQWLAITTRFTGTERLEQWSITQRTSALQDGAAAFKRHPLLGWGPGASLIGIGATRTTPSPIPLEPPHLVPFVILLETGILGLAATLAFVWFLLKQLIKQKQLASALPLLAVLTLLALTDHYLWTLWAGNVLFSVIAGFLLSHNYESTLTNYTDTH